MESEEQKISKIFEVLSASGAIEWIGVDNKGEPVYRFTDICKEVFPELYAIHAAELSQTTNELWQMGVVDIVFGSQGNSVTFTEVNHRRYREVRDELTEEQNSLLEVIVGVSLKTL
jgi:hypothetical protein